MKCQTTLKRFADEMRFIAKYSFPAHLKIFGVRFYVIILARKHLSYV